MAAAFNTWSFVCARYDTVSGTMKLRVNSIDSPEVASVGFSSGGTNPVRLFNGSWTISNGLRFTGGIDNVGMWGRCLSNEEVDFLYNSGVGRTFNGTIFV